MSKFRCAYWHAAHTGTCYRRHSNGRYSTQTTLHLNGLTPLQSAAPCGSSYLNPKMKHSLLTYFMLMETLPWTVWQTASGHLQFEIDFRPWGGRIECPGISNEQATRWGVPLISRWFCFLGLTMLMDNCNAFTTDFEAALLAVITEHSHPTFPRTT